jgi:hypothetical protein
MAGRGAFDDGELGGDGKVLEIAAARSGMSTRAPAFSSRWRK